MHCKAVQREPSQWKRPRHEQRGTVVLSPTHGADLATKTKTEKSSDYDTQSDTLTLFPVRDPLLHHTFIGEKILCFPLLMFRNVTLYIIFYVGAECKFHFQQQFILWMRLFILNTQPTFTAAINWIFTCNEIQSKKAVLARFIWRHIFLLVSLLPSQTVKALIIFFFLLEHSLLGLYL